MFLKNPPRVLPEESFDETSSEHWEVWRVVQQLEKARTAKRNAERKTARRSAIVVRPDPEIQKSAERRLDIVREVDRRLVRCNHPKVGQ